MDVLSDMLSTVRLRSTVFAQTQLTAPWGIRAEARDHFAFHVIAHGRGLLDVDGLPPVQVEAGDVVVIAPGRGHALRDTAQSPARDLMEMLSSGAFDRRTGAADAGDGQPATHLICGCFRFEDMRHNALMSALPTMIHTREIASEPWLAQTIKLLTYESLAERPGMATVVDRLCDAMFVYILRSHLIVAPAEEPNWLRALVDPQIGAALRLMHEETNSPLTVAMLAARVAMSRSAFAARFRQLVGEPPMQYLARWRLQKAAAMLRDGRWSAGGTGGGGMNGGGVSGDGTGGDGRNAGGNAGGASIAEVAARIGYDSPAAFSKAFKRTIGVAPGAYRRANQEKVDALG